jgi:hypothetical protein
MKVPWASATARGSSTRSGYSSRKIKMQLGSHPTMGMSLAAYPDSRSTL